MHKIIPYILAACCLCMVASCDTVFDVHPYDVQIDGDRNLNVTNIQKIEAAVKSKDTIRFAMISDSHQWLDDLKSEVNDINRRSDSLDFTTAWEQVTRLIRKSSAILISVSSPEG